MNLDLFNGKKSAGSAFSFFLCIYILFAFIGQTFLLFFTKEDSFAFKFIASLFSPVVLITTCVIFSRKRKEKVFSLSGVNKFNYISIILSILICFGMYFGLGLANVYFSNFIESVGLKVVKNVIPMDNAFQFSLFFISICVLPSISEEMFFRGLLNNLLGKENVINRVLFTSLCFALYHMNISQFVYQFIYGVVFSLLYEFSKSVIPCMISHFINNAFILFMIYFNVDESLSTNVYMIICGVLVLGLVTFFIIKKTKIEKSGDYESIKGAYLYGAVGIALAVLTIVLNMVA